MKSQCQRVLKHFARHKTLTSGYAWQGLGIMRLAARINDLVNDGYAFDRRRKAVTNQFGEKCSITEYRLKK